MNKSYSRIACLVLGGISCVVAQNIWKYPPKDTYEIICLVIIVIVLVAGIIIVLMTKDE